MNLLWLQRFILIWIHANVWKYCWSLINFTKSLFPKADKKVIFYYMSDWAWTIFFDSPKTDWRPFFFIHPLQQENKNQWLLSLWYTHTIQPWSFSECKVKETRTKLEMHLWKYFPVSAYWWYRTSSVLLKNVAKLHSCFSVSSVTQNQCFWKCYCFTPQLENP